MTKMTIKNLKAAFAGESQAAMKYTIFADVADKKGKKNVAKLFRAIAYAEQVHAKNHLRTLAGINDTSENLEVAIDGENFEVEEMYPAYMAVAELQDHKQAQQSFRFAIEAEKIHSKLYSNAKARIDAGEDIEENEIYVCPVCGWTHVGKLEVDRCPICSASSEKFVKF
ncbi:MAG: rubrerythrin family protein [Candidatus Heimdallarchaeaceae archaeon]